ncbi:CheY chemotaxis protein or a CheY-like REC (receiver) domain [Micromonospora haikouensis]|uniref:CheY chemotaxis protein or a CheY-like REC (Receiver) domain n=1 Tax=Micromonospora haikouensis TaxID=686309 RepID=A0A1C4V5Y6_9ACTN|nr:CheY chemotaxis protein or a CheY-like REC (receiver) domain [Micromonospora haikouensis]
MTSAVATGDLTRSITVDASGEVAELKDNINSMVESLRETTRMNQEQDWLKTNLARISGLMQGHRDLEVVAGLVMDELAPLVSAQLGTFLLVEDGAGEPTLRVVGGYGHRASGRRFTLGDSLVGQAAASRRAIVVDAVPADYVTVSSSLGAATPRHLVVLPIPFEDQVLGVIELASMSRFTETHRNFLDQLMETIGVNVNTIVANARTDVLLTESQRLAAELRARSEELQARSEELQRSNAELEDKAALLARQNGRKGIETLMRHDDIDLVLMDVMMPEMDGYAATAAIRAMPRYGDLPIIAVTAKAMRGDREKSITSGASDYVTKPVDAEDLLHCIHRWLDG